MNSLPKALETISQVQSQSLKLQFDLYHQQILHGDIISNLRLCIEKIAHIQVAGVPQRNEPNDGELNFDRVARELIALNYQGFIGCEYKPSSTAEAGLTQWAARYL
jgi:hydroxypyruvate isomerase